MNGKKELEKECNEYARKLRDIEEAYDEMACQLKDMERQQNELEELKARMGRVFDDLCYQWQEPEYVRQIDFFQNDVDDCYRRVNEVFDDERDALFRKRKELNQMEDEYRDNSKKINFQLEDQEWD